MARSELLDSLLSEDINNTPAEPPVAQSPKFLEGGVVVKKPRYNFTTDVIKDVASGTLGTLGSANSFAENIVSAVSNLADKAGYGIADLMGKTPQEDETFRQTYRNLKNNIPLFNIPLNESKKLLKNNADFYSNAAQQEALKTPDEINFEPGQKPIDFAKQFLDPRKVAGGTVKMVAQNIPFVAAASTGYPATAALSAGYLRQDLQNSGAKDNLKTDLTGLAGGAVIGKLETLFGDIPAVKKLLMNPSSKIAQKEAQGFFRTLLANSKQIPRTMLEEGFLEEGPQQIVTNIIKNANGIKTPIFEGVPESVIQGAMAGGGTVAGAGVVNAAGKIGQKTHQQITEEITSQNPTLSKEEVEKLVQAQMIIPDNTPDFSQPTTTENYLNQQDVYNKMANEGWGQEKEYDSPSPEQLLGHERNPEINQAIANEYQAQGELFNEYQGVLESVLGYYPSLESFKGKAISDFNNGTESPELEVYRNLLQYENLFNEKGIEHHNLATLPVENNQVSDQVENNSVMGIPATEEQQGIEYLAPDESVEYYKPNQPQKNKVPENLRLMAENAQQYDKYSDWLNAVKKEGSYTTKELADEVKQYGFNGLRHFYNKRNNIQPIEYQDLPEVESNIPSSQENIQPEIVNQETNIAPEIQPTQEEVEQAEPEVNPIVEGLKKEIKERAVKKVEKRKNQLIDKAVDEGLTPEEENELIQTETALLNIKKVEEEANNVDNRNIEQGETVNVQTNDVRQANTGNEPIGVQGSTENNKQTGQGLERGDINSIGDNIRRKNIEPPLSYEEFLKNEIVASTNYLGTNTKVWSTKDGSVYFDGEGAPNYKKLYQEYLEKGTPKERNKNANEIQSRDADNIEKILTDDSGINESKVEETAKAIKEHMDSAYSGFLNDPNFYYQETKKLKKNRISEFNNGDFIFDVYSGEKFEVINNDESKGKLELKDTATNKIKKMAGYDDARYRRYTPEQDSLTQKNESSEKVKTNKQHKQIIELTGKELGDYNDIKELRSLAREEYRKLQNEKVTRDDLGDISFTRKGFDKLSHTGASERKYKLIPKLKEIIKTAKYVNREQGKGSDIIASHWLENDVILEGNPLKVGITILEDENGNKFYNINQDLDEWNRKYPSSTLVESSTRPEGYNNNINDEDKNFNPQEIKNNEKPDKTVYNNDAENNNKEVAEDADKRTSESQAGINASEILPEYDSELPDGQRSDNRTDVSDSEEYEDGNSERPRNVSSDNGIRHSHKLLVEKNYKNNIERNKAIKEFIDGEEYLVYNGEIPQEIKDWLGLYDGFGGIHDTEGTGSLSEYYTPDQVISKMWDITNQYIEAKDIFEPSAGIGRFLKVAPENANLTALEMDKTSGKIAQILYPNADINIGKFQDLFLQTIHADAGVVQKIIPNSKNPNIEKYDVIIGNPPYGDYKKTDGEMSVKENPYRSAQIEEHFIARGLDLLKENGILTYIVPSSFLKNGLSVVKQEIAKRGTIIDAYRLPNKLFDRTSIGTDIIVIRKESKVKGDVVPFTSDNWFKNNPDKIIGTLSDKKGQWGSDIYEGDISDLNKIDTSKKDTKETVEKQKPVSDKKSDDKITKNKAQSSKVVDLNEYKEIEYETYKPNNSSLSHEELSIWARTNVDGTCTLPLEYSPENLNYFDGEVYNNFNYFQGDIYEKLDQLEADKNKISKEQYNKQKAGLEKVLPEKLKIEDIEFTPTQTFLYKYKVKDNNSWRDGEQSLIQSFINDYLYKELSSDDLEEMSKSEIASYIQGKNVKQYPVSAPHKDDSPQVKRQKNAERDAYANKRKMIGDRVFNQFLRTKIPADVQQKIIDDFNRQFNSEVLGDYKIIPILAKNISKYFKGNEFKMYAVQQEGVGFSTNKGVGIIGFEVGVGKTITGIVSMQQALELGRAKRPLVMVPKSTYENWVSEIKELMPNIKIHRLEGLSSSTKFKADQVKDGEVLLATYEALSHIWYNEDDSVYLKSELAKVSRDSKKKKSIRDEKNSNEELNNLFAKAELNNTKRFDISKLGVDFVMFDEAHKGKNLFDQIRIERETEDGAKQANTYSNMKLSKADSTTAKRMFLLAQHILMNNKNRNVLMLTATPFNNHAVEIYNMLSYVARDELQSLGLNNVYDFMETFADVSYDWVVTSSGSIEYRQQLKGFKNLKILRKIISKHILFRTADDAGIERPIKKQVKAVLEPTSAQAFVFKQISELLSKGGKKEDLLAMIGKARKNTISHLFADGIDHKNYEFYSSDNLSEKEKMDEFSKDFVESSPKIKYIVECIAASLENDSKTSQIIYSPMGKDYFKYIKNYLANNYKHISLDNIVTSEEATEKYSLQDMADDLNNRENKVKILIGTQKIKEGMNLNKNTSSLYLLGMSWNPTDQIQVEGRIHRQGNKYKKVRVVYPLLKNSSDSFMLQKLEEKIARFNNIWESNDNYFSMDEIDAEEEKFALISDPEIKADFTIKKDQMANNIEIRFIERKIKELDRYPKQYEELNREIVNAGLAAKQTKERLVNAEEIFKEDDEKYKAYEKFLKETKNKNGENIHTSSYEYSKSRVKELKKQLKEAVDKESEYKQYKANFLVRMKDIDVDINDISKTEEKYKNKIEKLKKESELLKEKRKTLVDKFKKEIKEESKNAKSLDDNVGEFSKENPEFLGENNFVKKLKARRGSVYIGTVSSREEIKGRIIKSFSVLKAALDYIGQNGLDITKYSVAKFNNYYHVIQGRKIQVESNTPKNKDTFAHQDLFARMRTILSKNSHTYQIYLDAKDKENNFSKLLNAQKELLIEFEHGIGESLSRVMDIMEGKKQASTQKEKQMTEIMRKAIDKQGTRVLNTLLDSGYLRPKTEFINSKATQVFAPDGTFIGEAYSKKEVDKIFREYMHANWKKENYFPHVFKGFYPVIAELKEVDKNTGKNKTHFIGRAYTTAEARKVYDEYIADNSNKYSNSDFTGKVTLDTSLSRDDNEYVLVGLPDLKKIKDKLNDEDSEFDLTADEIAEIQSLFVPKRDVKKARKTGFAEKRENYEGYIKDPIEALEAYFYSTEKFIQDAAFLKKAMGNITKAKLAGIQSQQPNLYNQALAYVRAVTGDRYVDEKAVADFTKFLFENVLGKPNAVNYNWYPKVSRAIRKFEYLGKLGLRLDHLIIQPALTWINVFPELSAKGKNKLDGEKYLYKGIQKTCQFLFDKELQKIVKESGLLDAGFVESMESALAGNLGLKRKFELAQLRWKSNNKKKAIKGGLELMGDVWMGTFSLGDKSPRLTAFFGRIEQLLDEMNYKSTEEAKKAGKLDLIIKEAVDFSDNTNFKYSVTDAPATFRSQTGKTLLQFKQFMVFQLGLWKDMAMRDLPILGKAIKTKNFDLISKSTPLAKSMLFAFLLFGATGLPFSQDISNVLAKFMPDNVLLESRQNDFVRAGLPSLFGIDLSASGDVRLQQFIPVGDDWKLDVTRVSPFVGTAKNTIDFFNNIGELGIQEATDKAAKREFPGYKKLTKGKFLAFKTIEESKEQFVKYEYSRANKFRMKNLVKAEARGDEESMKRIVKKISESKYYKDYDSFQKGFNATKNYMISKDSEKAIEAFKKQDKATFVKETKRIAKKWYGGDIDKAIEKLSAKIDKSS